MINVFNININDQFIMYFSDACSIPDGASVLVTGGSRDLEEYAYYYDGGIGSSKVRRYNLEGWVEDLPDLTVGRRMHGCAAFTMEEEQVKRSSLRIERRKLPFILQIYLVVGGCSLIDVGISCHEAGYLSSSEIYRRGQWVTAGPLPVAVAGVRGVALDNTVFMTGQLTFYSENTN